MNRIFKNALGVLATTLMLVSTPSAFAAFAGSLADVSSITITETGSVSILSTTDFLGSSSFATDGIADVANNGMTFDSFLGPMAEGTATNSGLFGASSFAEASADPVSSNVGSASTIGEFVLDVEGSGSIIVEVDYVLDVESFDNLLLPDGEAYAKVDLFDSFIGDFDEIGVDGFLADFVAGTLSIEIPVFGPETLSFFVTTEAVALAAAVPVPAAVWLFGSALAGMMAFRRKQQLSAV